MGYTTNTGTSTSAGNNELITHQPSSIKPQSVSDSRLTVLTSRIAMPPKEAEAQKAEHIIIDLTTDEDEERPKKFKKLSPAHAPTCLCDACQDAAAAREPEKVNDYYYQTLLASRE